MGKTGVRWYYDTLTPSLRVFPAVVNARIQDRLEELAREIEAYMKENAPWEDRSGEAREGLGSEADIEGFTHSIHLYHTAEHGIWLEVKWSGRYAIIVPTMEAFGPKTMASLHGVIGEKIL